VRCAIKKALRSALYRQFVERIVFVPLSITLVKPLFRALPFLNAAAIGMCNAAAHDGRRV
jgi:hypothetical protein